MKSLRQCGFSLLELLVTLFVVVLVTSLVTLNVGSGDRDVLARASIEGLAKSANYALDEAQFSGMNYGLLLQMEDEAGQWRYHYDWLERTPTGWQAPTAGKDVFSPGDLPSGIELELELDGVVQEQETLVITTQNPQPQIILYASGETLPGALDMRASDNGELLWRIEWNLLGDFRALQGGEPTEEDFQ